MSTETMDAALEVVKRFGWYVFRLNITHNEENCDGGTASCKSIDHLGKSWPEVASNDLSTIQGWDWLHANAYGIDCGQSGIVVADRDPGATWPHGQGTRVHTTGRGTHYIYEDVIGLRNDVAVKPWGIDIRGVGGYIVGPGSVHPHGGYSVEVDADPASPPRALLDAAARRPETPERGVAGEVVPMAAFEARTRLEGVYRSMAETPDGERNDTLNVLAGTAGGIWVRVDEDDRLGLLDEDEIRERLFEAIPDDGDPEKSRDTIRRGWAYGIANPVSDGDDQRFFDETPTLRHIRQFAHARLLSAPALLAHVLARVLVEVPPGVTLPPVVGDNASLNFGVSVVGGTGAGKSLLIPASRVLIGFVGETQKDYERPIGSGEGLAQAFLQWDKDLKRNVLRQPAVCLSLVDEVDSLGAIRNRNGATIGPVMRSALTGGTLGQQNAEAVRERRVPAGVYRLVMMLGVQPTRADALLDDTDAGTPQRLVWVKAADPNIPDEDVDDPGSLDWEMPADLPDVVDYPERVKAEVRAARRAQARGHGDPTLGHRLLTRLKVAAALALLHGETAITEQWWGIAEGIIDVSVSVQDECRQVLNEQVAVSRKNAGRLDSIRQEGAAEYNGERAEQAARAIWKKVDKHAHGTNDGNDQRHDPDAGCTRRCVTKALQNYPDKEQVRDLALSHAVDADWIEERGERWFPGDSQPAS